jgi:iron(II)-dependent oxidoreductase
MRKLIFFVCLFLIPPRINAQGLKELKLGASFIVENFNSNDGEIFQASRKLPLFSYEMNHILWTSGQKNDHLEISCSPDPDFSPGFKAIATLRNISTDTIEISNLVPFGASDSQVHITGKGDDELSRTCLFLPGKIPVNVICPDNAWELGYGSIQLNNDRNACALARREPNKIQKGQKKRFETILYPGGSVSYAIYVDLFTGDWQEGLNLIFRQRYLYDLKTFDDSLFNRKDLEWIRHAYIIRLLMAWDKSYFDYKDNKNHLNEDREKQLYGGDDVIGLWPTWPSLGLDQRNQFDLFRDLPGGTRQVHKMAMDLRKSGTKLFICYNPWDESTRSEGHLAGLASLIRATSANGVVLDTRGSSSRELQQAADQVSPGVIMYSEGMAVVKDMPGIVAGRVHNALYYPPMLNLNKFIKPEFAIFRVAELQKEPIQREFALAFFNGYGTELNMFSPGQPAWLQDQYKYLGRTSRILRENSPNFVSPGYTPLIQTNADSIWVNQWKAGEKTVYTIYSIIPSGYKGYLFRVLPNEGFHFVDLWHHRVLQPKGIHDGWFIEAETDAFHRKWLGTNNEGAVDCVAQLPMLLQSRLNGDVLSLQTSRGGQLRIWAGTPDYSGKPLEMKAGNIQIHLSEFFGSYEGDFVIQLMENNILLDENIVTIPPGTPRRMTPRLTKLRSKVNAGSLEDLVRIPAGKFIFKESHGDEFIPYPKQDVDSSFDMPSFYMDKYPVTNIQFRKFLQASKYRPSDTSNFLKHWKNGRIPRGEENFPVVYVSYEDARAYSKWSGKNLPTELEWQYAAQTVALNEWPWKQTTPVTRKEQQITETLTVTSIDGIDSSYWNLGHGILYAVGKYPKGANPNGLQDLVGSVWQMTNDLYLCGPYRYIIMKGGSYFNPSSSWWYVQGGPRELNYRQYLLRVSQGFERNATVGFRCMLPGND